MDTKISNHSIIYVISTISTIIWLVIGNLILFRLEIMRAQTFQWLYSFIFEIVMLSLFSVLLFAKIICQKNVPVRLSKKLNIVALLAIILLGWCLYKFAPGYFAYEYTAQFFVFVHFVCAILYDLYRSSTVYRHSPCR